MFLVALIVFLAVYWAVATISAWLFYQLARGYEDASPLPRADLWKRSALAGAVAVGITVCLGGLGILAFARVGKTAAEPVSWVLFGLELCVWAVFCLWLCDLENLLQGALYALVWMVVLRVVAFLVFFPFGVGILLIGGLGLG